MGGEHVNMYSERRLNQIKSGSVTEQILKADLDCINSLSEGNLAYSLSRFICEIKKLDGSDYHLNTLREIVIMIQMYLNENSVYQKLLDGAEFVSLRNVLDNTMKEHTAQGLGMRNLSNVISLKHEDMMFWCGALGDENPSQLLHTVIYMMGLHLALCGRVEHNRLHRPGFNCQIQVVKDQNSGKEKLFYQDDPLTKTNQGGLGSRHSMKTVSIYEASNVKH